MKKIIIAAVAKNNIIGKSNGEMPWHLKEEFEHFKNTTLGHPIIMGKKTFESLGSPLGGRLNIVVSKNSSSVKKNEGYVVLNSLNQAFEFCKARDYESAFVIGGGEIFNAAIKDADEMIISHLDFEAEGDIYFPQIDMNIWQISSREKRKDFEIVHYIRKK